MININFLQNNNKYLNNRKGHKNYLIDHQEKVLWSVNKFSQLILQGNDCMEHSLENVYVDIGA